MNINGFLQRWQGYLRSLKANVFKNHKFLLIAPFALHVFVRDFVSYTIDLPQDFKDLRLDQDCYESVIQSSPAGSLTPPGVYKNLIQYTRSFYNKEKAVEVWTPRGASRIIDTLPQLFAKYEGNPTQFEKPLITIFPRARVRASNRNIPEFVWRELVDKLKTNFLIVLAGTPDGACLQDYKDASVKNLIMYNKPDKTEQIIGYLNNSVCSISSQSGGTHISLLSDCPSYIIGHEKERHTIYENRYQTPTSFRYVMDYRIIDSSTIIQDVAQFLYQLEQAYKTNEKPVDEVLAEDTKKLNTLIGKSHE